MMKRMTGTRPPGRSSPFPVLPSRVEQSYRYIIDEYEVTEKDIAIFMPCAVRKPYSASPSHQLIRMIISQVFEERSTISSSSVPAASFRRTRGDVPVRPLQVPCSGKCKDPKILDDFLHIETDRVAGYLEKTRHTYQYRIAYCIGLFREALNRGSEKSRCAHRSDPPHPGHDQQGRGGRRLYF